MGKIKIIDADKIIKPDKLTQEELEEQANAEHFRSLYKKGLVFAKKAKTPQDLEKETDLFLEEALKQIK